MYYGYSGSPRRERKSLIIRVCLDCHGRGRGFESFDDAGGFHLVSNDNIHVSGAGDQGSSYVGGETDHSIFNGRVGVEQTSVTSFTMISKGSAPNFYMHILPPRAFYGQRR